MGNLFGPSAIGQMLMTLIAFGLVLYIAYRMAWQPIAKILQERQAMITKL